MTRYHGSSHWLAAVMTVFLALLLPGVTLGQSVEAFDPNTNGQVNTVVVQADGKILVGGFFTSITGAARRFTRLNADGTLDTNFNPNVNPNIAIFSCVRPDSRNDETNPGCLAE